MDNQHRHIKGYRELNAAEIALINEVKEKGKELEELIGKVRSQLAEQYSTAYGSTGTALSPKRIASPDEIARLERAEPGRWVAIAKTDFQTGLMALTRAIAQPTFL